MIADARDMRSFFDALVEDMHAGRETWRVLTFLSSLSVAVTAFLVWW